MDNQDVDDRAVSEAGGSGSNAANGASEPEAQRPKGRLLVFKRRSPSDELAIYRLLLHNEQSGGITERTVAQLVSKHAPPDWQLRVGHRVAGCSGDRIVQGTVLGTKSEPCRPAAFYRDTFTACWLLLDSGERAVANELRPIAEVQTNFQKDKKMSDAKNDPKDKIEEQLLEQIFQVFGKKQEPGEPALESLPPSRRLIPDAPLNKEEIDAIIEADIRWYGIKEAPPDDPIYLQGWTISFVPRSKQNTGSAPQESQPGEKPDDPKGKTPS